MPELDVDRGQPLSHQSEEVPVWLEVNSPM
jgi:hypothetical protein